METDEFDDELPPITFSGSDSFSWSMPSAGDVAAERAREAAYDREIRLLRESAAREGGGGEGDTGPTPAQGLSVALLEGNSSGSESEGALTATLESLRVCPEHAELPVGPCPVTILTDVRAHVTPDCHPLIDDLIEHFKGDGEQLEHYTRQLLTSLSDAISTYSVGGGGGSAGSPYTDAEVLCVCACALACVCAGARGNMAALLLRQLVANVATQQQRSVVARWLGAPRQRAACLPAAECVRPAPTGLLLARAALLHLWGDNCTLDAETVSLEDVVKFLTSTYKTLSPQLQYSALQIVGRILRDSGGECEQDGNTTAGSTDSDTASQEDAGRESLVERVLRAADTAAPRDQPDKLRVAVAASKLQLLFRKTNAGN